MRRLKVLEVLEASVGGARKHVLQILHGLDRERFELHLACSAERDPATSEAIEALRGDGIRVEVVPMLRRPAPFADLAALHRLARLIRGERYDVVHTHCAKAGFLGRRAAWKACVPAVLHTPHCFPFQRVDTPLVGLYRWLERRAARWAHRIVLVADSQRQVALDAGICPEEQLAVVQNGIELPSETPERLRRRYREELGLRDDELAVAFVGRVTPQKDVQAFLSMAEALLSSIPNVALFLVGSTEDESYLRSLRPPVSQEARAVVAGGVGAAEPPLWRPSLPIRVLGHRADAAELVAAFDAVVLPSRYEGLPYSLLEATFDAVVLPSRYEGLPYSLLEAMACGVPAVASDVTGCCDAIEDGVSGFLVSPARAPAFAQKTARLLGNADLRRRMGAAARERVASGFTVERFLEGLAALYESLLPAS